MLGPQSEDDRRNKMSGDPVKRVKVTTRIRGKLKQLFFADSIRKDIQEAKLAESIFKIHYAIVSEYPALSEFDYKEVRKMDSDKLRDCIVKVIKANKL